MMMASLDYIPVWALRLVFAVTGLWAGVGVAVLITAFVYEVVPPVDVTVRNKGSGAVDVRLDFEQPTVVPGGEEATLADDATGHHRLAIITSEPDALRIEFRFYAERYTRPFSVEVGEAILGPPSP